jgi:hypothetical protein
LVPVSTELHLGLRDVGDGDVWAQRSEPDIVDERPKLVIGAVVAGRQDEVAEARSNELRKPRCFVPFAENSTSDHPNRVMTPGRPAR